jgi:hypothetical protein
MEHHLSEKEQVTGAAFTLSEYDHLTLAVQ